MHQMPPNLKKRHHTPKKLPHQKNTYSLITLITLSCSSPVYAADFTISNGTVETTSQTLNDNETGTIEAGGELNTITDAIDANGINNTVTNQGSIATTGDVAQGIDSDGANASISNNSSITTSGDFSEGIISTGENVTIKNSGNIATSGSESLGIASIGENATITNIGTLTTTGLGADGIVSDGANANINNSGSIDTTADFADAILSTGANTNIRNSGSISTAADFSDGIDSNGENADISNSGTITTTGFGADGIGSNGANTNISNSGSILTAGDFSDAIRPLGDNATINNSGSILTAGDFSGGIRSLGDNATIKNSGSIATTGAVSEGIRSSGANTSINNSGSISTVGGSAEGIESIGAFAIINNSGRISTLHSATNGIFSRGINASVSNSGSIATTGSFSHGIFSTAANVSISNNGSITTTSNDADGILSDDTNATINNSGSIITTGDNANGIAGLGDNAVINNSGFISATGKDAYAILGDSSDSTLNILAGSHIIGVIDLGNNGDDNDTVNIHASGSLSVHLSLTNVENINLVGASGVANGQNVLTVDPTGESSRSVALSGLTTSIHGMVSQRMAPHAAPVKPIQVAALTLSPGMLFQQEASTAWGKVFGGNVDYDAQSDALAYGTEHLGFTLGYEWEMNQTRFGLLGGAAHSRTTTDIASFKTESNSYYLGGYALFNLGGVKLTSSLLGGYATHDNERLVMDNLHGLEVAQSDSDSVFLSPSLTLSSAYTLADRFEFRPSANINYSMARLNSSRETGTTNANLKVDDRTLKVLTARIQLAAAYQLDQTSEIELRAGLNARQSNDDDIDSSLAGNSFSYNNAVDENVTGRFAGVNLRVAKQDNLGLIFDMEFGGDSDEDYMTGEISLEYRF